MSDQKIVTELKVSGHLMKLETGLYCVFHSSGNHGPNPGTGLPGVRISLPPGTLEADGGVEISGFRNDGWVSTGNDAALIRVTNGPAQVLVTVYQSALGTDGLPQLQVVRLGDIRPNGVPVSDPALAPLPGPRPAAPAVAPLPEMAGDAISAVTAHVQRRGDVSGALGAWIGERGSKLWIEGFSVSPPDELRAEDLEYQAVLGRGWLSPWSQGGQFCGSRRMALPLLGLRVRLRGATAASFECAYSATFTDGTAVGPVAAGEACEAENLAPLESFQVILRPRQIQPVLPPPPVRARTAMPRAVAAPPLAPATGSPAAKQMPRPPQHGMAKRAGKPRPRRR